MQPVVLCIILAREFAVSGLRMVAAGAKDGKVIAANIWGKVKTVLQMLSIIFYFFVNTIRNTNHLNVDGLCFVIIVNLHIYIAVINIKTICRNCCINISFLYSYAYCFSCNFLIIFLIRNFINIVALFCGSIESNIFSSFCSKCEIFACSISVNSIYC